MGGAGLGNREIDGSGWVLAGEVELEPCIYYHFFYHSDALRWLLGPGTLPEVGLALHMVYSCFLSTHQASSLLEN